VPQRAESEIRLSVVIVGYRSCAVLATTLPALVPELQPGDQLVVVDNGSGDGTLELVREIVPEAVIIANGSNAGFAAGANAGVRAADGDLVVVLNPDAVPQPGFGEAIRRPLAEERGWTAWMALVTAEHGRVVNTSGGVVHFTGIAWAGEHGMPVERVRRDPHEVGFASGACLAVPRDTWLRAGGFSEDFFMYHEDVELSLRLRLAGGRIGIEPTAVVDHDYEFAKGAHKWRLLERNRWATILRCYPGALLALVAPALAATELATLAAAATGGWLPQKLRANLEIARSLPRLLRERHVIRGGSTIAAAEFARGLTADLDSPYLGWPARSPVLRMLVRRYWATVVALLR
jgi:N-acetylglucosaminyl-diphospho-decaprenol L-rhamnosyltransferase